MNTDDVVKILDNAWDLNGCFGRLRNGELVIDECETLLAILEQAKLQENGYSTNPEFVRLAWFIPLFMSWQRERVEKKGGDMEQLISLENRFTNLLFEIFGTP